MESLDFFIIMQAKHNKWVIRQDSRAISCLYITCFFLSYLYSNELWSAETIAVTLSCLCCVCVAILGQKKLKLQSKSYVFCIIVQHVVQIYARQRAQYVSPP